MFPTSPNTTTQLEQSGRSDCKLENKAVIAAAKMNPTFLFATKAGQFNSKPAEGPKTTKEP